MPPELETKVRNTPDIKIANSFIIPFADHLHYAVARAREGLQVDYPLAPEVTLLYPREVEFGRRALDLVHERLHLTLDPQEAIPWRYISSMPSLQRPICHGLSA